MQPHDLAYGIRLKSQSLPRMGYRRGPVSVAVEPVSLVISECIAITSAIQKHARSPHSSVSAILGGGPSTTNLMPQSRGVRERSKSPVAGPKGDDSQDDNLTNRWGLRGEKGRSIQDNPLMAGFGKLRHAIASVKDIHGFDAPSLLAPFLQVMQTKGIAAPVTILALGALRKFLAYGFMSPESPRFALAMQSLSMAVTRCNFEGSDSGQIEVVLIMILELLEDMMSGPGGDMLSDESVCDMIGRGLAICSKPRFSPVLRCAAEASLIRMCQIIFEDVKHFEADSGGEPDSPVQSVSHGLLVDPAPGGGGGGGLSLPPASDGNSPRPSPSDPARNSAESNSSLSGSSSSSRGPLGETGDIPESLDLRPYSLLSIKELFRVLVGCLDPHERQTTDSMRVVALRILRVVLEVSGPLISRHAALASISEDRLCCYLFQLVRSDNMAILQEALTVAGTLLTTCRHGLKLQQELYLSYLIGCLHPLIEIPHEPGIHPSLYSGIPQAPKLAKPPHSQANSGRSTPVPVKDRQKLGLEGGVRKPDARQAMAEAIGVLSRMPTFMTELFVNYDCDADRADLCEDMVGLLSRNALPDSATWSTTSVPPLCLDALLRYIRFIAERLDQPSSELSGHPDPAILRKRRQLKKVIIKGAELFNDNTTAGLGYLHSQGIIEDAASPQSVAAFLVNSSRISKKILGEFLSKKGNEAILDAYMSLFDFSDKRVDAALRLMLETFRLPGEAPLISRIVTAFSERFMADGTRDGIADKDSVFILTYAIILLNTDQHNPNVKNQKRMRLEDFSRNLGRQNGGQDFAPDYLREIFDSIRANEIILPDEHDNKHAFDYAWKELLLKTEVAGSLTACDTNLYDADMFEATWRPVISTLSYVFMSATDDAVFARVVAGFDECARIATKYGLADALDHIIYCLSHMSTLATETPFNTRLNTEVQAGDHSVMVSELAVTLGRDVRAQLATIVLFRVVNGSEAVIRTGWKHVIRVWLNLFINSLAPPFFSKGLTLLEIPAIPLHAPSQVIDRAYKATDAGFFSAFTSYISSYAADDPPEPSDDELESTLCTVDCVDSCHIENIFDNIAKLPSPELGHVIDSLLGELPDFEDNNTPVMAVKSEAVPVDPTSGSRRPRESEYDPSVVYILEFCTVLVCRDSDAMKTKGRSVSHILHGILRHPTHVHSLVLSRTTMYALKILHASYHLGYVNVPVLLHAISGFPRDVLEKCSPLVLRGFNLCVECPGPLRNEMMTSPDFWAILRVLSQSELGSQAVFDILESGASGEPPAIIADNYEASVSLLNAFASAAGSGDPSGQLAENTVRNARPPGSTTNGKLELVARGMKAMQVLQQLTGRIPQLMEQSHLESSEAWSTYWLPVLQSFAKQCTSPSRDVRLVAFKCLQRSLLAPELTSSGPNTWTAIFSQVLFPFIHELLKPEIFSLDKEGMSEMRVQSTSLLCKVFLQYLVLLSAWDGMLDLWVKIIEIMDRLMNSGQGDILEEAVHENLKNVILFMSRNGFLVPPKKDAGEGALWNETWKRIDRFLPSLKANLVLDEHQAEGSDS